MRPFPISALVRLVGDEHIQVQPLLDAVTNVRLVDKGRGSSITFRTASDLLSPGELMSESTRYLPLVVWLPRQRVEAARAEWNKESAVPTEER